ncbi:MAG: hypothetical protein IJ212_00970 [Bacteroidaceae bacterium]|nr:hypothetical protein [Bacteroidaceae bacterium]
MDPTPSPTPTPTPEVPTEGVFILNEGNLNAGNSSLSYYIPAKKSVKNGVFSSTNSRKLGDTAQSMVLYKGTLWIAVENSGIIWAIDAETFKVKGQIVAKDHIMDDPRYIHFLSDTKAYVTDLFAPLITIINPSTYQIIGTIPTGQAAMFGFASTEQMVQYGKYVFTNCWSYSNKILVIDTTEDKVVKEIELSTWQPKSMVLDANGKIWVITDGGYSFGEDRFSDNVPHLYKINASNFEIESDQILDTDEANVQLALNGNKTTLYILNNDIFRMSINESQVPVFPFISAPVDGNGKRHFLYGLSVNPKNDEIYVADAIDYSQSGVCYRYSSDGELIDNFRVGINPNMFVFQ